MILNPLTKGFNLDNALQYALTIPKKERVQLYRDIDLYRAIQENLAKIYRPDFEEGTKGLVKRKYVPNPKQESFYLAATEATGRGRWYCGGNRSGKTETGVREDLAFCIGFRPWFDRDHDAYLTPIPPPTTGRIVVEDWEKAAKGNIVPKLKAIIPPELVLRSKKNQVGVEYLWEIKVPFDATGAYSTIEMVTNKSDVRGLEGWRGDWLHIDEPTRHNIFIALTRGLVDTNGHFWMTLTPLSEPWIHSEIVENDAYKGFYTDMWDNLWDQERGSGMLTKEGIQNYIDKLQPHEIRTRVYGEFMHMSGVVFENFYANVHVYPNSNAKVEKIPPSWWRDVFIDPGKRKPHCVVFAAWSPTGRLYIYDGFRIGDSRFAGRYKKKPFTDVIESNNKTEDMILEIKKHIGEKSYPQRFLIDPICSEPDWNTGTSMEELLMMEFPVERWVKTKKESAIDPLISLMDVNPETGSPRFFIHQSMERAIYELQIYRWANQKIVDEGDWKPRVVKKDDDYVDCILAAGIMPPPIGFDVDDIDNLPIDSWDYSFDLFEK